MEPHVLVCNLPVYIFGSGSFIYSKVELHNLEFQFESPIKVERSKKPDVVFVAMKKICSNNFLKNAYNDMNF